jgi:nucleotide-binding universal stress UspA family protein
MTESIIRRWSNPETILVVTDLLEGPSMLLHATHQASLSGAKILLAHVIRPSTLRVGSGMGMPWILPNAALHVVQAALDNMTHMFEQNGITCDPVLLRGAVTEQIPALVRSRNVDRVIVAARNACGVERLLVGSSADGLAAVLDVPVCIVGQSAHHPGLADQSGPGRVLVATSFRPSSSLCVEFASELAKKHHASLTMLHVIESARLCGGPQYMEAQAATGDAYRKLADGVPAATRQQSHIDLEVRMGDVAAEILKLAGAQRYDFIVLGSPPDSVVSRILGSSVIHRIISEAECPVFTVKPINFAANTAMHEPFYAKPDRLREEVPF